MTHHVPVVVACIACVGPLAVAQSGPFLLGSEDEPELWGDDTVSYHPAYPLAKDHDYLAINRSWYAIDETNTRLTAHLRVLSTDRLAANEGTSEIHCSLSAKLPDPSNPNAQSRTLVFQSSSTATNAKTGGSARINQGPNSEGRPLETTFEVVRGTPGYYVWSVSRDTILSFGPYLLETSAVCRELAANLFQNEDSASSASNFSVAENRRVAAPDGALDPIERYERENGTNQPLASTSPSEDHRTPGFGILAAVVATAFSLLRRGRD